MNKSPDAAAKFAEVQRAYDVLSDEKKRALYDKFGPEAFESAASEEAAARAARGGPHYAWQNVAGGRGGSHEETGFDPDDISSIFESMFGARGRRGAWRVEVEAPDQRHKPAGRAG